MSLEVCWHKCPVFEATMQIPKDDRDQLDRAYRIVASARLAFVNAFYLIDMSSNLRSLTAEEYESANQQIKFLSRDDDRDFVDANPEFVKAAFNCVEQMLVTEECTLENIARLPH